MNFYLLKPHVDTHIFLSETVHVGFFFLSHITYQKNTMSWKEIQHNFDLFQGFCQLLFIDIFKRVIYAYQGRIYLMKNT